jgi:hypothetical protein
MRQCTTSGSYLVRDLQCGGKALRHRESGNRRVLITPEGSQSRLRLENALAGSNHSGSGRFTS